MSVDQAGIYEHVRGVDLFVKGIGKGFPDLQDALALDQYVCVIVNMVFSIAGDDCFGVSDKSTFFQSVSSEKMTMGTVLGDNFSAKSCRQEPSPLSPFTLIPVKQNKSQAAILSVCLVYSLFFSLDGAFTVKRSISLYFLSCHSKYV